MEEKEEGTFPHHECKDCTLNTKTNSGKEDNYLDEGKIANLLAMRVMVKDKKTGEWSARVPFHIPGIPRPQDQFNILVDNTNQPFRHECLDISTDCPIRYVHPLEKQKLTYFHFMDGSSKAKHLPLQPKSLQDTPFKFVDRVDDLKELALKLRSATEFAVDLEHNQYRSFLGLTCLMQISTRTEDFIIDTLKLRVDVGPHLRDIFKDPSMKKIMHGADRDILWLQRDFGIYVCNLFDTGQASRVLNLERNSLEYLLHHYCGIVLNKEYQNADWRLRPIPKEMLRYAREDTHHLLYLYDLMQHDLLASRYANGGDALLEAYKRSYGVCMQFYEKELLTNSSYLFIYGLREANFNCEQLAATAALYEWRDGIARAEDESTGFVLPNKVLLEIARQLPITPHELHQLVGSKHHFVECQLGLVVNLIKCAIANAPAFACVLEQLEEEKLEAINATSVEHAQALKKPFGAFGVVYPNETLNPLSSKSSKLVNIGYGQLLKKPSVAFKPLLDYSSYRQKLDPTSSKKLDPTSSRLASSKGSKLDAIDMVLQKIRATMTLPSFSIERPKERIESPQHQPATIQESDVQRDVVVLEEMLPLGDQSDDSHHSVKMPESSNGPKLVEMTESFNSPKMVEIPEYSNIHHSIQLHESSSSPQSVMVLESSDSPKDSTTQTMENIESLSDKKDAIDMMLEKIRAAVTLPSFSIERPKECLESSQHQHATIQESDAQPNVVALEEIIPLRGHHSVEMPESSNGPKLVEIPESSNGPQSVELHESSGSLESMEFHESSSIPQSVLVPKSSNSPKDSTTQTMGSPSLAKLSSNLEKCFDNLSQPRDPSSEKVKPWKPRHPLKMEPYDDAASKKRVNFGGSRIGGKDRSNHKSGRGGGRERKASTRGPFGKPTGESTWRPQHPPKVEPYDYAAARKCVDFGGDRVAEEEWSGRKSNRSGRKERKVPRRGPSSGEPHQAFAPFGNRISTFQ